MNLKKCSRFVIILLLSISSKRSFSQQLTVTNRLSVPITICIGWDENSQDWQGMRTKGWYEIFPGQSIDLGLYFNGPELNEHFYFYAKTNSGPFNEVTKGTKLLVHPTEPFDIKNANLNYVKDQNPVYQWRMFKRKDIVFKKHRVKDCLFEITISDITDGF